MVVSLKDILEKHNFKFKKKYGQNFITDPGILKKIVSLGDISSNDVVVEIGPGAGTLTKAIAVQAGLVIAIEIDKDLLPILEENLAGCGNVRIIEGDALKINLDKLVEEISGEPKTYKIIANLPYYITSPLVMHFLESGFKIKKIVIMVQKEVAERFTARPGTKDYGALTVILNLYTKPRIAFFVSRNVFTPKPDVDSAVVELEVREELPFEINNIDILRSLIKAAFNQRRKTLTNALKGLNIEKEQILKVLEDAGIDPQRRGETLSLEEFVRIANRLSTLN
ncbi:MAG: 16S rRNA (adenine(1518)-N(6)/adenine(1519)-N(6))-dimethyltransferase RsmA [Clostridia bacterium]|nr:16S rRNA (adenine(1518)-N(6)/adenine(1519)-N(6))-dimethyltransferase RsmA [Clostridia bacterium]